MDALELAAGAIGLKLNRSKCEVLGDCEATRKRDREGVLKLMIRVVDVSLMLLLFLLSQIEPHPLNL